MNAIELQQTTVIEFILNVQFYEESTDKMIANFVFEIIIGCKQLFPFND